MSKSSFNENNFLFAPFIAESGMFTANYGGISLYSNMSLSEDVSPVRGTTILYNPMPPQVQQEVTESVPIERQADFISAFHGATKYKLFDRSAFDSYAQALFEKLVPNLVSHDHDVLLFPLRGCRQPGILVKVIAGIPEKKMVIFNYTYATQNSQQAIIESQLSDQLREKLPDQSIVSVGIVDTAKGGYGSRHLAELLARLHGRHFPNQYWSVQFHLLHESHMPPVLSHEIPKFGNKQLLFLWPTFYEVESLLVEDWPEGIGLAVEERGKRFDLKRCVEPGRILYRDEESVQVIESQSLCDTMTSLTVDAVNRLMLSSPEIQYVKDVWNTDASNGIDGREK